MNNTMETVVEMKVLTPENARFYQTKNGILMGSIPSIPYEGRVFPAKAFPFEKTDEYICVLNEENEEQGMILDLSVFDEESASMIREELKKRYFTPKIKKIFKINEQFGATHWECESDFGPLSFTMKDVYRNIIRMSPDRIYLVDVDGCRYEIESIAALDKKSFSKIELYV